MTTPPPGPDSPCVRICVIDAATGLCTGCGRTLDEIARWSGMNEAERRAVNAGLPSRLALMRPRTGRACALPRRR